MKHIQLLACLVLPVTVFADDAPVVPPQEFVYCTVCHGADLKGNRNIEAPRLSGMESWYVERQLEAFAKGWRGTHETDLPGIEMRPMAEALSKSEIREAARYAGAVTSPVPKSTVQGDEERGMALYQTCSACHGPRADGNQALGGPALTTQNDWYLVTQLENYRDNVRGHAADDTFGQQMRAAAQLLEDDRAIADVVAYISTLQQEQGN